MSPGLLGTAVCIIITRRLRKAPRLEHREDHLPRRKWFMGHSEHVHGVPKQSAMFEHDFSVEDPEISC
jgi:hypothetical protein